MCFYPFPTAHTKTTETPLKTKLKNDVINLRNSAYAEGTFANRASAWKRYLRIAELLEFSPIQPTTDDLSSYVVMLHQDGLKHNSILQHLNAVRHHHLAAGVTLIAEKDYQFVTLLRGISKRPEKQLEKKQPLSSSQLIRLLANLKQYEFWPPLNFGIILAFISFIRQSNLARRSANAKHSNKAITFGDIILDAENNTLKFLLKETKTRSGNDPIMFQLNAIHNSPLCPVTAFLDYMSYLEITPSQDTPLLVFTGTLRPLTLNFITKFFRTGLANLGFNPKNFTLHSLRRSAALTAKLAQVQDPEIAYQGTWAENSIWDYIGPYQYLFSQISDAWTHLA